MCIHGWMAGPGVKRVLGRPAPPPPAFPWGGGDVESRALARRVKRTFWVADAHTPAPCGTHLHLWYCSVHRTPHS